MKSTDMPISLYYADMARSQWRPIATNLRNVGSYEWTLPPNLPEQIQIRLDVEDVAGNLTTAETRNGIPLASGSCFRIWAARVMNRCGIPTYLVNTRFR